jgi:hypothetical protein
MAVFQTSASGATTRILRPPAVTTSWDSALVDLEKYQVIITFCYFPPNADVVVQSCFLTSDVVCVGPDRTRRTLTRCVRAPSEARTDVRLGRGGKVAFAPDIENSS